LSQQNFDKGNDVVFYHTEYQIRHANVCGA